MSKQYRDEVPASDRPAWDEAKYTSPRSFHAEMSDQHLYGNSASHTGNPTTEIVPTAEDERNTQHVQKRFNFLKTMGLNELPFAMSEYPGDAENHVQRQVEAYATHVPDGSIKSSIPASVFADVDTGSVPDWVYFPAQLSDGNYIFNHTPPNYQLWATNLDDALKSVGLPPRPPRGGKKRSHKKSGKKSEKKKGGKKSHKKSHKRSSHKKRSHRRRRH
jgi:hypothetical protein